MNHSDNTTQAIRSIRLHNTLDNSLQILTKELARNTIKLERSTHLVEQLELLTYTQARNHARSVFGIRVKSKAELATKVTSQNEYDRTSVQQLKVAITELQAIKATQALEALEALEAQDTETTENTESKESTHTPATQELQALQATQATHAQPTPHTVSQVSKKLLETNMNKLVDILGKP